MKTIILICLFLNLCSYAQQKPAAAVLKIHTHDLAVSNETLHLMLQLELEKTKMYSLRDPYEVREQLKSHNINMDSCISIQCMDDAAKMLGVDKVITGRYELLGQRIAVTLKVIDVASMSVEKSSTSEFINLPDAMEKMTQIAIERLMGIKADHKEEALLVYYEQPFNNPKTLANLSGPRIGAYTTTGDAGKFMRASKEYGGFEMGHVTTAIG